MSISDRKATEAMYWKEENGRVRCLLCPYLCFIADGKRGVCGVRENRKGVLYTLIYGLASSVMVDPIEKKPLFHFYPGTDVLSFGTVGCNFACLHCQNYSISQSEVEGSYLRHLKAKELPDMAKRSGSQGIAWTYNEPSIWYEFTLDGCKEVKKEGLYTVYVTNGYISKEPLKEIAPYLDAMNIDVKSMNEDFYRKVCKAKLQPVLDTCILAKELGIHIEVTYLIIPTYNDSAKEIRKFCKWVVEKLGEDVPCHFSRFHPDYKMTDVPRTPMGTMDMAHRIAKEEGLKFVYLGNIPHTDEENTYCPKCGKPAIERWGFSAKILNVDGGKCGSCGTNLNIIS